MDSLVAEEALFGTPEDQSPRFMITDVLGTLAFKVDITKSLMVEEEEEGSRPTPENNAN